MYFSTLLVIKTLLIQLHGERFSLVKCFLWRLENGSHGMVEYHPIESYLKTENHSHPFLSRKLTQINATDMETFKNKSGLLWNRKAYLSFRNNTAGAKSDHSLKETKPINSMFIFVSHTLGCWSQEKKLCCLFYCFIIMWLLKIDHVHINVFDCE